MTQPVAIFCVTTPMSIPLFGNRLHLLVEAGIDLNIVVGEPITESIAELPTAAKVHVVPMTRSINLVGDLIALLRMVKLQRKLSPRLVAAATPKASLIGLLAARFNRVPVRVWEVWGAKWDGRKSPRNQALMLADRIIAGSANRIVAVSRSLSELLVEERIVRSQPEVIGNGSTKGVDTLRFCPASPSGEPKNPTIGFVGRISIDKGFETLIEVASALRESIPCLTLLLVGDIDAADPPSAAALRVIDHASWLRTTGWVLDTAPYYSEIDLLLFPSLREGLPNAVLEAASSGIPVVAYDAVGTRDSVVSGETGYLVPKGDREEMLNRTQELMLNPEIRQEMGRLARQFVTSHFDARDLSDLWINYYLRYFMPMSE